MPIDTEHPEYTKRKIQWEKLRDCADGQEAVHAKGEKYLKKLSGQDKNDYEAYKGRAAFYGATGRTVDGLSGMVFRKPPTIDIPEGLTEMANDVTLSGLDLRSFAEEIIDDGIIVGRAGILVDHPAVMTGTTRAEAEAMNARPFLKHYQAEQIFNWKVEGKNNAQVNTQIRLWEWVEIEGEKEFDATVRKQIRILDFNEEGQYRQRVFIEKENVQSGEDRWIQDGEDIIPMKNGEPLDVIPFFFVGVKNGMAKTEKPPLIDLANVNLSHYVSTADLEHGAHFTGLPTAVITGHTEDTAEGEEAEEYRIGAATAWVFPNPETEAFYLEFNGQGLSALENRIDKKEQQMAFLGARIIATEKKGVEAAQTAQINRHGETSVLSSLAQSAGQSIEDALSFMAEWAGFDGDIVFKLNNDFLAVPMTAQELTALLATWQAGGMAFSDFLENLKRGEIVRDDREEDEIRSEIETESPFQAGDLVDVEV